MRGNDLPADCCIIYNPFSNRGRNARHAERLQRLHARNRRLRWLATEGPGDAEGAATRLAQEGCPRVIAMGGDGTVHEVVNGLMAVDADARPSMGVVPAGAGNDFAHVVGLPQSPEAALQRALDGARFAVDVGRIAGPPRGQRHWINSVGSMLDGAINMESHRWKRPRGSARYLLAALRMLATPFPVLGVRLGVDGTERALSLVLLTVANGPREGGVFTIAPDARPDDGHFDYLALDAMSRPRMLALLPRLLSGRACHGRRVHRGRGADMTVRADGPLIIHLDGELWTRPEDGVTEVRIELMPGALQVCR